MSTGNPIKDYELYYAGGLCGEGKAHPVRITAIQSNPEMVIPLNEINFRQHYESFWQPKSNGLPNSVKKVIFNDPCTIVIFKDGTKEIVRSRAGDKFDKEVGLAMALMNKQFGSRTKFKKFVENDCVDQNSGK